MPNGELMIDMRACLGTRRCRLHGRHFICIDMGLTPIGLYDELTPPIVLTPLDGSLRMHHLNAVVSPS